MLHQVNASLGYRPVARLWKPGTKIKIRFLDGSRELRKKVATAADKWLDYANLTFDVGAHKDADIRISFRQPGDWSYIGTVAGLVAATGPTANFQSLNDTTSTRSCSTRCPGN
jgi:hypothetical protein